MTLIFLPVVYDQLEGGNQTAVAFLLYPRRTGNDTVTVVLRLWGVKPVPAIHESSWLLVFSALPKKKMVFFYFSILDTFLF